MTKRIDNLFEDPSVCLDKYTFEVGLRLGYRLGQAYFNSLNTEEQDILRNTRLDPFYKDDEKSVCKAHEYLKTQLSKSVEL